MKNRPLARWRENFLPGVITFAVIKSLTATVSSLTELLPPR